MMQERVTEVGAGVRDWIGNWPWQLLGRCAQHCTFAAVAEHDKRFETSLGLVVVAMVVVLAMLSKWLYPNRASNLASPVSFLQETANSLG